jgi:signal transduction histidine kinase
MEAVQNAAKHSNGSMITVRLTTAGGAGHVTVVDDGVGFASLDARAACCGAGLSNMQDRIDTVGGTLLVDSAPGHGTRVTATVPVVPADCVV